MSERKSIFEWAKEFVGDVKSFEARGLIVRDILREEGLQRDSKVLELGCGALSSGRFLIDYLDQDCYVGIEPAGWLVEAGLKGIPEMKGLMVKRPRFLWRTDFDAQETAMKFDYVVGHSVLSHAAAWQLPLMLANARRVMNPGGKLVLSFRQGFADTNASSWAYPDITLFSWETLERTAADYLFSARLMPEYTEMMVSFAPNDTHDWLVLERQPRHWQEFQAFSEDYLRLVLDLAPYAIRRLMEQGIGRQVERSD